MKRLLVLQHLEREGPGLFSKIAQERGMRINIFRLDLGDSLPELAKGLGLGLREFKNASRDIKKEVEDAADDIKDSVEK